MGLGYTQFIMGVLLGKTYKEWGEEKWEGEKELKEDGVSGTLTCSTGELWRVNSTTALSLLEVKIAGFFGLVIAVSHKWVGRFGEAANLLGKAAPTDWGQSPEKVDSFL